MHINDERPAPIHPLRSFVKAPAGMAEAWDIVLFELKADRTMTAEECPVGPTDYLDQLKEMDVDVATGEDSYGRPFIALRTTVRVVRADGRRGFRKGILVLFQRYVNDFTCWSMAGEDGGLLYGSYSIDVEKVAELLAFGRIERQEANGKTVALEIGYPKTR